MVIVDKIRLLFTHRHCKCTNKSNDMENVVSSMFQSKPLYDKLKVRCHPDRFVNDEQKERAEYLFQELQKHKYNVGKMKELEKEINKL